MTICKLSKVDKINTKYFGIVSISDEIGPAKDNEVDIMPMPGLLPPAELRKQLMNKEITKKNFIKEYKKFLKKDPIAEIHVYNICRALESDSSAKCFVCGDVEWDLGYLQAFAHYMGSKFGIVFEKPKDLNKKIKSAVKNISKKERKGKKFRKAFGKILKGYRAENGLNAKGKDALNSLYKKFAIDTVMLSALSSGFYTDKDGKFEVSDKLKKMKKESFIKAIVVASKQDKDYKKMINDILDKHDLKIKKLKKLKNGELLHLCNEITTVFTQYRFETR